MFCVLALFIMVRKKGIPVKKTPGSSADKHVKGHYKKMVEQTGRNIDRDHDRTLPPMDAMWSDDNREMGEHLKGRMDEDAIQDSLIKLKRNHERRKIEKRRETARKHRHKLYESQARPSWPLGQAYDDKLKRMKNRHNKRN